jgi:hypothetical protein
MKQIVYLFLFLFNFANAQSPESILFIGNSMTYYNNMPTLFKDLANSKGKNVQTQQYAPGGTGFFHHVNDTNVYNLFSSQTWDAVILQPGTGESYGSTQPTSLTINRGKKLMDSIRKYSPCAKIILYEISNGVASNSDGSANYANYFLTQTRIKDTITAIANGMQIPFAPAGECFRHHYTASPDLLLHSSLNDVHPNLNGSYLVACSIFNTLYQENIVPSSFFGGISGSLATNFQNIADQVVLQNKPSWLINTYNLYADFSTNINGMTVQLDNLSTNYDELSWIIDGALYANQSTVNHVFTSSGTKTITLTASKDDCLETVVKQIEITPLSLNEFNVAENSFVYPNPSSNFIFVAINNNQLDISYSIFDLKGCEVKKEKLANNNKIDIRTLNSGLYMLVLNDNKYTKTIKFLKK